MADKSNGRDRDTKTTPDLNQRLALPPTHTERPVATKPATTTFEGTLEHEHRQNPKHKRKKKSGEDTHQHKHPKRNKERGMSGHKGNGPTFNVAKVAKERHDVVEMEMEVEDVEVAIEQNYQPPLCIEELRAIPDGPRIKKLREALSQALSKAFAKISAREFVKCLERLNVTEDSLVDLLHQLEAQVTSCTEVCPSFILTLYDPQPPSLSSSLVLSF